MPKHPPDLIGQVQSLRSQGKTYGEIQLFLNIKLSKSTLSFWCKDVPLPSSHWKRISKLNISNLDKARKFAVQMNKLKRSKMFEEFSTTNNPISEKIHDKNIAKIALAMLCLGEASKWSLAHRGFCLGNSDYRIIILFLKLLRICFKDFDTSKIRCTVQCRADQDTIALQKYWQEKTGIPHGQFYKAQVDQRTIGKPTTKPNYKGVLRIDYFNIKTQLDLESLSDLIYNQLAGPVV